MIAQHHHLPFGAGSNPNSPTFPSLSNSTTANSSGSAGIPLSIRPGTSLGSSRGHEQPLRSPVSFEGRGRTYLEHLKSWNDEEVTRWLGEVKLGQYAQVFAANDIRGNVLLDVDQQALKEMGIKSVGDRVKIVVGIKGLRQRCIAAAWTERRSFDSQSPAQLSNGSSNGPPASTPPSIVTSSTTSDSSPTRRPGSGRAQGRIPPPLHLSQTSASSNLPQAWQPPSATPSVLPRSVQAPLSPRSSPRTIPPPSLPPPRSQPPPPPPASLHRPTHSFQSTARGPSISTTAASPTSPSFPGNSTTSPASNWIGDYGLPRAPAPGNLVGGVFGRSGNSSPLPPPPPQRQPNGALPALPPTSLPLNNALHRRAGSTGAPNRPTQAASFTPTHPYATVTSPTVESFGGLAYTRPNLPTSSSKSLLPSPAIGGPLSPISDSTTPSSDGPRTGSVISSPGRDTGYASSARSAFTSSTGPSSSSSLDAVLRKAVKFIGEDGVSKMIAVADCQDGREIILRVLKKFQNGPGGNAGDGDAIEGWGIYRASDEGYSRALTQNEIFAICRDGQVPERQRGLVVRRVTQSAAEIAQQRKRGRKLQWMFGEEHTPETSLPGGVSRASPTSPNYLGIEIPSTTIEPASPSATSSSPGSAGSDHVDFSSGRIVDLSKPMLNNDRAKTNRASTISVMSGLGADWGSPGRPSDLAQPSSINNSPSPGSFLSSGRKLRNFFGQRPPSELIATHLTEYFPKAEKKLLSKQVRQSMRKSVARRDSQYSVIASASGTSWEKAPDRHSLSPAGSSRFSGSSSGSVLSTNHHPHFQSHQLPPLPVHSFGDRDYPATPPRTSSVPIRSSGDSIRSSAPPSILESAVEDDETTEDDEDYTSTDTQSLESAVPSGRISSRMSSRLSSVGNSNWDRRSTHSDAASILTVDEVTAELETRRASLAGYVSDEEEKNFDGLLRPPSIAEMAREEEMEDEEEEEEEMEDEPIVAVQGKPQTKWIKGALIGAGSFGSVYLGMNPMNGSLMAVKQVELPTGHSHNEERKKSMLDALEREIELLKVLQHENIVQYLDSSSDATHLNIFLEYVPGGSVAALLSNYGAFEEALVSKFVRQILTGLEYLHEREIIHRDIKGANILVDNKGGIKISDFGISKKVEDNLLAGSHRPSLQGSVYWMAPEVVKQTSYTSKADIWSLGCLVVEMLTGAHPWANLTQMQAIFRIGSSACPAIPEDISIEADDFLEQTFMIDHNLRPSATELLQHAFTQDVDVPVALNSQQTPTRATFSAGNSPAPTTTTTG